MAILRRGSNDFNEDIIVRAMHYVNETQKKSTGRSTKVLSNKGVTSDGGLMWSQ